MCCVFINWGLVFWKKVIGLVFCDKNNMYLKFILMIVKIGVFECLIEVCSIYYCIFFWM